MFRKLRHHMRDDPRFRYSCQEITTQVLDRRGDVGEERQRSSPPVAFFVWNERCAPRGSTDQKRCLIEVVAAVLRTVAFKSPRPPTAPYGDAAKGKQNLGGIEHDIDVAVDSEAEQIRRRLSPLSAATL
jgi:hypothetical protein